MRPGAPPRHGAARRLHAWPCPWSCVLRRASRARRDRERTPPLWPPAQATPPVWRRLAPAQRHAKANRPSSTRGTRAETSESHIRRYESFGAQRDHCKIKLKSSSSSRGIVLKAYRIGPRGTVRLVYNVQLIPNLLSARATPNSHVRSLSHETTTCHSIPHAPWRPGAGEVSTPYGYGTNCA